MDFDARAETRGLEDLSLGLGQRSEPKSGTKFFGAHFWSQSSLGLLQGPVTAGGLNGVRPRSPHNYPQATASPLRLHYLGLTNNTALFIASVVVL